MNKAIYILTFLFATIGVAQSNDAFIKGNNLYNEGKYTEAISVYESILESDVHSAELYFNLANSHYKLNRVAPSIYYYEKALQVSPNDADIKNNLSFAQNMTIDAIEKVPEVGFSKLLRNIVNRLSFDDWAWLSIICVMLFVMLFIMYFFSFDTTKKRLSFVSSFTILFLGLITLFCAFQKDALDNNDNPAIVFTQESNVNTEPNLRSEVAFELHEGTKVQVLESYNDTWVKIEIANGKTGWIATENIKLLNEI